MTTLLSTWEFYATICVIFIISRVAKWWKNPLRKIPGPRGYPVIGSTLDYSLNKDFHRVLLERGKKYGKIYKDYSVLCKMPLYMLFLSILYYVHFPG